MGLQWRTGAPCLGELTLCVGDGDHTGKQTSGDVPVGGVREKGGRGMEVCFDGDV